MGKKDKEIQINNEQKAFIQGKAYFTGIPYSYFIPSALHLITK